MKRMVNSAPYYINEAGQKTAHSPCRTLHDMSPDEIARLSKQYNCPVKPAPLVLRKCSVCGQESYDLLYDKQWHKYLCRADISRRPVRPTM